MTDFETQVASPADHRPRALRSAEAYPWVTLTLTAICVGIYLSIVTGQVQDLSPYGYTTARELRGGALYGLLAPAVLHVDLWHIAMNLYALWFLGGLCERVIGSWKYALLVLGSAVVASSTQFALTDATGIGISGVLCGLFGFAWIARRRSPEFQWALPDRIVRNVFGFLVLCVVLTELNIIGIANGAHLGGLLFGATVAGLFVLRRRRVLLGIALTALLVVPNASLVWAPWSTLWISDRAVEEHLAGDLEAALELYTTVIEREPTNGWAYKNRSMVYEQTGDLEAARRDRELAEHYGDPR